MNVRSLFCCLESLYTRGPLWQCSSFSHGLCAVGVVQCLFSHGKQKVFLISQKLLISVEASQNSTCVYVGEREREKKGWHFWIEINLEEDYNDCTATQSNTRAEVTESIVLMDKLTHQWLLTLLTIICLNTLNSDCDNERDTDRPVFSPASHRVDRQCRSSDFLNCTHDRIMKYCICSGMNFKCNLLLKPNLIPESL